MIIHWGGVLLGCCLAALLWTGVGWRPARLLLPDMPPWSVAGLLGFAWLGAPAPWLMRLFGTGLAGIGAAVILPAALGLVLFPASRPVPWPRRAAFLPVLLATPIAVLVMAAIMPKGPETALRLSEPLFDHLKIAIIDAILRQGVPPLNPYLAVRGVPSSLSYYYGWHLQAAVVARLAGLHGWGGDAALTGLTAFAALLLVGGLARRLGASPLVALLLSVPAGLAPLLGWLQSAGWFAAPGGLGGFLNQASWAPQHVAAAALLLLVGLLLATLPDAPVRQRAALVGMLAAILAMGVDASAWVGGIVTACAAPLCLVSLATRLDRSARWRLFGLAGVAALLAMLVAGPVLMAQAAQLGHQPVLRLAAYPVLAAGVAHRALLDVLAFPLLLLLLFPVPVLLGGPALVRSVVAPVPWQRALATIALPGIALSWFIRSTILNNDLGWRAVLPALLAALPFAAGWVGRHGRPARALGGALAAFCLIGAWPTALDNLRGHGQGGDFRAEAAMWRAVRAAMPADARLLADFNRDAAMTVWPANIGWALLSDRASCFAGWGGAATFVRLPVPVLYRWDRAIVALFAGDTGAAGPLASPALARCDFLLWQGGQSTAPAFPAAWRQVAAGPGWWLFRRSPPPAADP